MSIEKIVAKNMRIYIQSVLETNAMGGAYVLSTNPEWMEEALEIIKLVKEYAELKEVDNRVSSTSGETVTIQITKDNFFNY